MEQESESSMRWIINRDLVSVNLSADSSGPQPGQRLSRLGREDDYSRGVPASDLVYKKRFFLFFSLPHCLVTNHFTLKPLANFQRCRTSPFCIAEWLPEMVSVSVIQFRQNHYPSKPCSNDRTHAA